MPNLIGSDPSQISTNGMLGTLAFQDHKAVNIEGGKIGGVDVATIASTVLTGEELDSINSSANLVLRGGGTNLLTYSEDFSNAAWVKDRATVTANAAVAPDGTTTADKLVTDSSSENTHLIYQTVSHTGVHTFSVYAKAGEITSLLLMSIGASNLAAGFDLVGGVVRAESMSSVSPVDIGSTITHVGNGWYRCTATFTASSGTQVRVYLDKDANADAFFTGNGTDGLFIWGAQLVTGTSPGAYTKTVATAITTAAPALIDAPSGTALALPASVTPPRNGDLAIEATSNTTLTFKLRGTDGTVRSGTLTLA